MAGVLAGEQMLDPFPGVCWSHQVLSRISGGVMARGFAWRVWVDTMFMERGWSVPRDQRGQSLHIPSDHSPVLHGEVALGTPQQSSATALEEALGPAGCHPWPCCDSDAIAPCQRLCCAGGGHWES